MKRIIFLVAVFALTLNSALASTSRQEVKRAFNSDKLCSNISLYLADMVFAGTEKEKILKYLSSGVNSSMASEQTKNMTFYLSERLIDSAYNTHLFNKNVGSIYTRTFRECKDYAEKLKPAPKKE
ncbi:MAG: hypothetical protein A2648_02240 [Candidatus Lloydbacteria bacterium RIFCSPHIGHO2_01_FULL_41_20]|uniref:Uncharacterized protein n=1 Tax=Candidatus Lloydbacteria bacterium RIFCSPHIGHO2_01_FULL_41_20 TaxID=1798657 RepID=A0A1G2CRB6_9BACT|nr:MAG: hypothetical protein A2648_02240 [Candidatus Lloydbacteria bacterium RIFCSPHIGHO2_01_FULL_41_20]